MVRVHAEARAGFRQRIGDDEVRVLLFEFDPCVFQKILRFHGEADQLLALLLALAAGLQNIHGTGQGQRQVAVLLLDLLIRIIRRFIVRDSCREDSRVAVREAAQHRVRHVAGAFHVHDLHVHRGCQIRAAGHQGDVRAQIAGGSRQRVTHLAAGVVRDEAHRIQGFARGSRGDDDLFPGEPAIAFHQAADRVADHGRLGHAAFAGIAAGQVAGIAVEDMDAAAPQRFDIFLRGRVLQHVGVHRGHDQLFAGRRQERGRQHVVRDAVGNFSDDVRGRRGDHEDVRLFRQRDMVHFRVLIQREQVGDDPVAGQGLERQRSHELLRGGGHQHVHVVTRFLQGGYQFADLVGRDAAGYAD